MNRTWAGLIFVLFCAGLFALRAADTGTPGQNTHRIAGIGVMVANDVPHARLIHQFIRVLGVQDHSPALEQGLKEGDEILAIDNFPVAGLNLEKVVNTRLRGEQDSVVQLTVQRPGQTKPLSFSLIRKIIPVDQTIHSGASRHLS